MKLGEPDGASAGRRFLRDRIRPVTPRPAPPRVTRDQSHKPVEPRPLEQIAPALAVPDLSVALIEIDDPIRIICHGRPMVHTCAPRRIER